MRDRFPLLAVGALALFVGAAAWLVRGASRGRFAEALSTWSAGPEGARALYALAQESGLQIGRHQRDLEVLDPGANLVILGIGFEEPEEPEATASEVADGGTQAEASEERVRSWRDLYVVQLNEDEREALLAHVARGHRLLYVPGTTDSDPLLHELGVFIAPAEDAAPRPIVPPFPSRWTLGVNEARAPVIGYLGRDFEEGGAPILVDGENERVVGLVAPYGSGEVVVVSAPALAQNRALGEKDNARLWLSLLSQVGRDGPVLFDEFHHGFSGDRSIAEFATRYGLQFAVLQLLLALGVWILASRRFGRPRAPAEEERVGATDALFAASRLYREGRHHGHAAGRVAAGLTRELAAHAGLPPRATAVEVAAALRARGEATLAEGLEIVDRIGSRASSERDVESAVRRAVDVRQNLRRRRRMRRAAPEASRSTA